MQDASMKFVNKVTIKYNPLDKVMNDADKQRCGLTHLSLGEWVALNEWLDKNAVSGQGPKPNIPGPG